MGLFKLFKTIFSLYFMFFFSNLNRDPANSHFQITDTELSKSPFPGPPNLGRSHSHTIFWKNACPNSGPACTRPRWTQCQEETNCKTFPNVCWFASKEQRGVWARSKPCCNPAGSMLGRIKESGSPVHCGAVPSCWVPSIKVSPFSGCSPSQEDKFAAGL